MKLFNIDLEKRIFGLDMLRAAAISYVMYAHGKKFLNPYVDNKLLSKFSMDGVTLFFVLSGFLIGRILLKIYFKEAPLTWNDLWQFWVRRWFRTVPPYFIMLTILVAINLFNGQDFEGYYVQFYLFIQNLWYVHPPFFPEAWSLSVEEWFYLSFPFLLFFAAIGFKLRSRPAFLFTVGCFFLLAMSYRTYISLDAISQGMNIREIYGSCLRKIVISRVDSMMFGVLAAYIYRFHKDIWEKTKNVTFVLGLLLFVLFKNFHWAAHPLFDGVFSFTMVSLATFLLLPKLNSIKLGKGLLAKLVVLISLSSYSMYLINLSFRDIIYDNLPHDTGIKALLCYALFWVVVVIISAFCYQFIEYPILKLRDKLYKKQSI